MFLKRFSDALKRGAKIQIKYRTVFNSIIVAFLNRIVVKIGTVSKFILHRNTYILKYIYSKIYIKIQSFKTYILKYTYSRIQIKIPTTYILNSIYYNLYSEYYIFQNIYFNICFGIPNLDRYSPF